jgi:OPT family oligopeptide transporter
VIITCPLTHINLDIQVPPRVTFMAQMVSCFWSSIVQVAVLNWALGAIKDVCTPHQVNFFYCPNAKVFFNASVIWGLIGPQRIFSPGQLYHSMLYFFIAGLVLPIVIYLGARQFPRSPIRYMNAPIIFGGSGLIPPATPLNYLSWGIVGFVFNKFIRNRHRGWWMYYNYIL